MIQKNGILIHDIFIFLKGRNLHSTTLFVYNEITEKLLRKVNIKT